MFGADVKVVMSAAMQALEAACWDLPWGADADHLKTRDDVRVTAQADFPDLGDPTITGPHGLPGVLFRRCPARGDTSGIGSRLAVGADRDRQV